MKNNYTCCHWAVLIPLLTLFFQLGIVPAYAENPLTQQIISGTISDQKGLPLPGVNVIVKGTSTGTMTNLDGNYSIRASIGDTLLYSYVGYQTLEKELRPEFIGDLIMQPATDALSEVVINAGYYNTTERERTGNIARVSGEDIQLQPVVNPLQALQGRMAGVEITPGGSHPGMAATIRIRGTNSLRQEGNYPLYIIDGVPVNPTPIESSSLMSSTGIDPLNNLDINNIKSIEILKDADATAIYGSRGANGVILITTKIGYNQGTSLDVRLYHGGTTAPQRYDLLNTQQYLAVRKKAFENDGIEPTERNAYDLLLWEQDRYTDWQDFLFGGTAETTNANLNFSGGNNTTSFRFGTSYFSQGTIYPGDYNYHKITGNLNLNHRSENQKFNLNLSLNYGVDTNKMVGNVGFNSTTAILPPNAPEIFNEDGSLAWELWERANLDNPLKGYFNESNTQTNNLISNISLSYEVIQGLQLKANMGYTYYDAGELRKQPKRSYNPADENIHSSSHYKTNRTSWIIEPQLIYNTNINQLTIEALLGTTFQENKDQMENFQGRGYASEALIGNLAAAESIVNARTENNDYRYSAIFSRLGFHWDKKYFLNLTGRRDGSSRFGPSNRFANFGAIGMAWIFTEEPVIKNSLPFLSFGKLRGSYGTTGNDQIGDYGYLDAYEATTGTGGLYPTGLANPNYSWEVNKKLEVGLELGFIENKLHTSLSYYQNRSSNQLVGYPLPAITGFTTVQANLPASVENRGWEIELTSQNLETTNFRWQTSFNISFPKNELVSYPDIEQSSYANTYRIGYPLNISLLYEYTGLDPETGFYTVKDVNEDGSLDYQDRLIIKDQNRKFYGGINNSFSFKNFSLQFLWQFVKQEGRQTLFSAGRPSNTSVSVLSALEGDSKYQKISQSSQASKAYNYVINTGFPFEDASFLRLKTLSLSYKIPKNLLKQISIKNCRLFMHGQNLWTLTDFTGLDPEIPNSGIGNLRSITGGLEINF